MDAMIEEIMVGISLGLMGIYGLFLLLFLWGWMRMPGGDTLAPPEGQGSPLPFISVVIPARNEQAHLGECLDSLCRQTYPSSCMEVILVDDHSTDSTAEIAGSFASQLQLTRISLGEEQGSGGLKKAALARGIREAKGEILLTTDADCILPPTWVEEMGKISADPQAQMVLGPVKYKADPNLLGLFQTLDFMAMQGITVAVNRWKMGIMGNGANLGFRRAAYEKVGGYQGIDHLASGDDYLLMAKIRDRYGHAFLYRKTEKAMVTTYPPGTWGAFWSQRIRWASKTGKYKDPILHFCLFCVYLTNALLIFWTLYGLATGRGEIVLWLSGLKLGLELLFLIPVSRFFRQSSLLFFYPFLQPLHWVYIVVAGTLGWYGEYRWKGRSTR